jgi:hypothetical protein
MTATTKRAARQKSQPTSVDAAVAAATAALAPPLKCPSYVTLRERDEPFWHIILQARARDEWTEDQLVIAAQLARCQSDIEHQAGLLDAEGMILEKEGRNESMIPFANPRVSVLEQLARRQIYLMRTMGMTGIAANGDKRDLQGKRKLEQEARRVAKEFDADDLLA